MSAQKDFVRIFHPTAEQEYASRRLNDKPEKDSPVVLALVCGCFLGAVSVLLVIV